MKRLVILEMANNHGGNKEFAKQIITEYAKTCKYFTDVFDFAIKFQLRDLDTFIHASFKDRYDLKYVKRFKDTSLLHEDFIELVSFAKEKGFQVICTAFDESSVDFANTLSLDALKIASCSFNDWPLLNYIADNTTYPIIASTAGAELSVIDNVVFFFKNRNKILTLMHCVGEYPTNEEHIQLNQIDLLRNRYKDVTIGFSSHEDPRDENVSLAIAKKSMVFEKHITIKDSRYPRNGYSVYPNEFLWWLKTAKNAIIKCGVDNQRHDFSDKEIVDLRQFKRGVFAKKDFKKGDLITRNDVYYAWPSIDDQLVANDMSKYAKYVASTDIKKDGGIMKQDVLFQDLRKTVWEVVQTIKAFIKKSHITIPSEFQLELSHHYGIDKFYQYGLSMFTIVNREYCKKILILLPNQIHPEQYHFEKEETFFVVYGEVNITLNGEKFLLKKGDVLTVPQTYRHIMTTTTGCIIEELSTKHLVHDSYYTDEKINENKNRKTVVKYWL